MKSMKFFKIPPSSRDFAQNPEENRLNEPVDVNTLAVASVSGYRGRSSSCTRREMPKAVTVIRSSSDISLASTVALDDSIHTAVTSAQSDLAAAAARQLEIDEMRNFVRKQKTKLPVLMDSFMDFVGHQIVAVMNTIASYKEITEGARVSRADEKRMKLEHTFSLKVRFNILPELQDVGKLINSYSHESDPDKRKLLCRRTKETLDRIYKMIAYLMDGDCLLENFAKCHSKSYSNPSRGSYIDHQIQIRHCLLSYGRIHREAEDMYRVMKFS
ncbi:uncharacterized protein LOC111249127 isoform X2 [Varroa destructor]|uniref:Uncharacterized protein n=1 Tax=Varroa destructor TaxID=109461 RepID=A0A7M7JZI5_VARDE|nr:uncharacterized protein LOC111249127 isoform X2 [Varroa destructor]